ncbi:MAG TPA: gamma-butyrobetaine hydroxylase-like domain-containing protein [Candidatus Binatia bacterium]|nr:gamma-butyrobetaine hydroxylase-like domain-containing protein [Candidatus Binatia bacterium]
MAPSAKIRSTSLVGRYALGVDWSDGHDSIMPFAHLRAHCPCEECAARRAEGAAPGARDLELAAVELLGDESVFLRWSDGHETLYLLPELRALCRCAYCVGEPERPITG